MKTLTKEQREKLEKYYKPSFSITIDENSLCNWENEEFKFFVIEYSKNFKYVSAAVYTKEPFERKTFLLFEKGKPIEEFNSLEGIGIKFDMYTKVIDPAENKLSIKL